MYVDENEGWLNNYGFVIQQNPGDRITLSGKNLKHKFNNNMKKRMY